MYRDKADNSHTDEGAILAETSVRLVPILRANMEPNRWEKAEGLWQFRKVIERVNSQMTA